MNFDNNNLMALKHQGNEIEITRILYPWVGILVSRLVPSANLPPSIDLEDLVQVGSIGLMAGIKTWKPEKGPCIDWVSYYIATSVFREIKRAKKLPTTSLDETPYEEASSQDLEQEYYTRQLLQKLQQLPEKQREAVALSETYTISQIARILGISRSSAKRLHTRGVLNLLEGDINININI